ncbi:MAG: cytochrome c [Gemmatimonadetes bacterium]|nr:cytochrome c [Gemmatimonadota bacterium]
MDPRHVALTALLLSAACGGPDPAPPPDLGRLVGDTAGLVERGAYIVRDVSVCGHCHAADPEMDPDGPLSGGMAFNGWRTGTIRAANITPDVATGIGDWSDAEVVRALRTGVHRDGRILLPIMPYFWFNGMSDRDALAVARYLRSRPPVEHGVENDPSLFYRILGEAFVSPEPPVEGPQRAPPAGPTAEYGAYLATRVALCADCHTPREGIRQTWDTDRLFAGADDPPSGFPARPDNLTPDSATGIGDWSEEDFLRTLDTGVNPAGDTLHPFMPWRQVRRMRQDDLRAIYRYLRTLPPIRHEVSEAPPE